MLTHIAGDLVEGATLRMTYRRPWPPIPLVVSCRVHHAVHGRSLRWSAPHGLAARLLHADHGWSLAPGPTPGTTTFTHDERFTGALAPLVFALLQGLLRAIHADFNAAVRRALTP